MNSCTGVTVKICRYFTYLFFGKKQPNRLSYSTWVTFTIYFSKTYEFIVKNFANNSYVYFLLTKYKSYSGAKTGTEEKYKTKIEKQRQRLRVCRAVKQTPMKMAIRNLCVRFFKHEWLKSLPWHAHELRKFHFKIKFEVVVW